MRRAELTGESAVHGQSSIVARGGMRVQATEGRCRPRIQCVFQRKCPISKPATNDSGDAQQDEQRPGEHDRRGQDDLAARGGFRSRAAGSWAARSRSAGRPGVTSAGWAGLSDRHWEPGPTVCGATRRRVGRPRLAGGLRGGGEGTRWRAPARTEKDGVEGSSAGQGAGSTGRRARAARARASGSRKTRPRPAGPRAADPRDPAGMHAAISSRYDRDRPGLAGGLARAQDGGRFARPSVARPDSVPGRSGRSSTATLGPVLGVALDPGLAPGISRSAWHLGQDTTVPALFGATARSWLH